ncbi:MAG: MarP family serine protease [Actinobacteria bacterium]|nr:MarP family serine protease [Actinomycetota bacterium]
MNIVDLVVIIVAVLAGFRGWRRGLLGQVFELGGGFLGLVLGITMGPRIADAFSEEAGLKAAIISLAVVFVALSVGQTVGYILGHRFGKKANDLRLGRPNQAVGAAFGVGVWLLSFWLIGSLLVSGPSKELARSLRKSKSLQLTSALLPKPPNLLAYLSRYLDTSGFPQVFAGLPRLSEPARLPTEAQARAATKAGQESTVRIVTPACGGIQLGSGWITDSDSVVTNAHVVAGGTDVEVQELDGSERPAVVVLYDPETDIAVLHVPGGLSGPSLDLETELQERGAPGAALGYPGNAQGRFVPQPAAVNSSYNAQGRDIYGSKLVTREVYELRSRVRQGNSGGPFVLPNGSVAGVVFAASTTDGETGYALTGAEVEDEVTDGATRTSPVDTGDCTH